MNNIRSIAVGSENQLVRREIPTDELQKIKEKYLGRAIELAHEAEEFEAVKDAYKFRVNPLLAHKICERISSKRKTN